MKEGDREIIFRSDDGDGRLTIDVKINDQGGLEVFFHDVGSSARAMTGGSDYERAVIIAPEDVPRLAVHLIADRYRGDIKTQSKLEAFCKERGIARRIWKW